MTKSLAAAGRQPLQEGITNQTLRRTFCAVLYEAGTSPASAMGQMGHASAGARARDYSKVMTLKRDTGARMDVLLQGADCAQTGNGTRDAEPLAALAAEQAI